MELTEIGRTISTSFGRRSSSFQSNSTADNIKEEVDEVELQWAAIERLPTFQRLRTSIFEHDSENNNKEGKQVIDVTRLGALERHLFIEKLISHIENDNRRLLQKLKERIDRVDVELPNIEVRYKNLCVEAECEVVEGKPLPTLWNSLKSNLFGFTKHIGWMSREARISILKDVSGIIKPSRMTLLLGPPGCGKTTLLLALAGKLSKSLKITGDVSYNGCKLDEFVPHKTSAYISQNDLHIPEMTVRETLDFSALCLGVGSRAEIMTEVSRREKQAGIIPDTEIDTYMKAIAVEGLKRNLQTDYILKILGLDICANTMVGDNMKRGISGGQKKRLTTGEMIVGPTKALFMDEISTGLDSSTTFQIVTYIQQFVHMTDATVLVSLLQPAPETFELFDDVILMAEGKIIYHGPRNNVLEFFEECGFKCPERKGVADYLYEVISRKDQAQYWYHTNRPYSFVSVNEFCERFKQSYIGQKLDEELSEQFNTSQHHKNALSFSPYSLSKWSLLKACTSREVLLMKRNSPVYIFKAVQLILTAFITMTIFIRTRMSVDLLHANYYMGALFYTLIRLMTNGVAELSFTITRLPVFYKQRDFYFYPAWAYSIPASILKLPFPMVESFLWTAITYYVIGYSPEPERFFKQFLLLFALYQSSISMCRLIASVFPNMVAATTFGNLILVMMFIFGGFVIPKSSLPPWLEWGFWVFPMSYGEIGLSVNEFLAPRWQKVSSTNGTIGGTILTRHGLDFDSYFYWISVGALFGFSLLFEIGFTMALTYLNPPGKSRAIISREKLSQLQGEGHNNFIQLDMRSTVADTRKTGKMTLPFEPLTLTFQNVQYFVEVPQEMRSELGQKNLQLLCDVTGAFRPGVLTALMGISGAGKTTLMDVLSGRKTGGTIEGEIKVGGYPKVQETFARISGYCEQTDIHSPQITVEESLVFSAWLRLPCQIDKKTKSEFVREALETIELDEIKDNLVGIPDVSGLSTEQRKRLTIAVELVSNPSIIFMDEPTSGLDARAAAIVMRAVKNVVGTGRTTVCTIHQPSIDIFEAFDELILMKRGGKIIYSGPLGQHSNKLIEYFQGISGVPEIEDNHNPATWMLEVTSASTEAELGVDFAKIYKDSLLYQETTELVQQLSKPPTGSRDLHFPTRFPQSGWEQLKACLWKVHLSYWRSPEYNLVRFMFMILSSILFAAVFWQKGQKLNEDQDLFNILGSIYSAIIFLGLNNCSSVLPFVMTERTVLYREKFAGMYSSRAYSIAQVLIEIPYVLLQAIIYTAITYPTIGYYGSAYKVFWYLYASFCTFSYYVYLGMLIVSLSSNLQVASILAAAIYTIMNLFTGYLIPGPKIPGWWIWCYWICPTAWTLNGLFTSQYGDIHKEITIFGERKTVSSFLEDYYGFHHDRLGLVAFALIAFPVLFAFLFSYFVGKLNFQRR